MHYSASRRLLIYLLLCHNPSHGARFKFWPVGVVPTGLHTAGSAVTSHHIRRQLLLPPLQLSSPTTSLAARALLGLHGPIAPSRQTPTVKTT
ncbi:hypothetical protein K438DRAFT_1797154, partial [Mycena galopus ATCC 62051]